MLDLSNKGSHQYWHEYRDPMIYRVICFMESVEDWTLDGNPKIEAAMQRLSEAMSDIGEYDLNAEDDFIKLACFIRAGRFLRLMQAMDVANPGAASKLLMHAENETEDDDDLPGLFLRRNVIFERLRLLGRVFSEERFKLVLQALEEHHDD